MEQTTRDNLTEMSTWTRMAFVVLFSVIFNIAELLVAAIVVVQFLSKLVTGRTLPRLQEFGRVLARYLHDVVLFLTYESDVRPFPFAPAAPEPLGEPQASPGS